MATQIFETSAEIRSRKAAAAARLADLEARGEGLVMTSAAVDRERWPELARALGEHFRSLQELASGCPCEGNAIRDAARASTESEGDHDWVTGSVVLLPGPDGWIRAEAARPEAVTSLRGGRIMRAEWLISTPSQVEIIGLRHTIEIRANRTSASLVRMLASVTEASIRLDIVDPDETERAIVAAEKQASLDAEVLRLRGDESLEALLAFRRWSKSTINHLHEVIDEEIGFDQHGNPVQDSSPVLSVGFDRERHLLHLLRSLEGAMMCMEDAEQPLRDRLAELGASGLATETLVGE